MQSGPLIPTTSPEKPERGAEESSSRTPNQGLKQKHPCGIPAEHANAPQAHLRLAAPARSAAGGPNTRAPARVTPPARPRSSPLSRKVAPPALARARNTFGNKHRGSRSRPNKR